MKFLSFSFLMHLCLFFMLFKGFRQESNQVEVESRAVIELVNYSQDEIEKVISEAVKIKDRSFDENSAEKSSVLVDEEHSLSVSEAKTKKLTYLEEFKAFIEQKKKYPRLALRLGQVGVVKIKMTIDSNGVFHHVRIAAPAESPILNEAALALIQNIKKFKPLPKGVESGSSLVVPIKYSIRGGV